MKILDLIDDSKSILVQASGPVQDIGNIILVHKEIEGTVSNAKEHDNLLVSYIFTHNKLRKSKFTEGTLKVDQSFHPFKTGTAMMIRFISIVGHYFDLFTFKEGVTTLQKETQLLHYSTQVKEEHRRMLIILNGLNKIGKNRL